MGLNIGEVLRCLPLSKPCISASYCYYHFGYLFFIYCSYCFLSVSLTRFYKGKDLGLFSSFKDLKFQELYQAHGQAYTFVFDGQM